MKTKLLFLFVVQFIFVASCSKEKEAEKTIKEIRLGKENLLCKNWDRLFITRGKDTLFPDGLFIEDEYKNNGDFIRVFRHSINTDSTLLFSKWMWKENSTTFIKVKASIDVDYWYEFEISYLQSDKMILNNRESGKLYREHFSTKINPKHR